MLPTASHANAAHARSKAGKQLIIRIGRDEWQLTMRRTSATASSWTHNCAVSWPWFQFECTDTCFSLERFCSDSDFLLCLFACLADLQASCSSPVIAANFSCTSVRRFAVSACLAVFSAIFMAALLAANLRSRSSCVLRFETTYYTHFTVERGKLSLQHCYSSAGTSGYLSFFASFFCWFLDVGCNWSSGGLPSSSCGLSGCCTSASSLWASAVSVIAALCQRLERRRPRRAPFCSISARL